MLVSRASRLAFVHVQKTGGSSVNWVLKKHFPDLSEVGSPHIHFADASEKQPELESYYVFGFVRNPWDRLVSWYSMIATAHEGRASANHPETNWFWRAVREDFSDFDDFVRRGVGNPKFRAKTYRRLRVPQVEYFTDPSAKFRADFVGRTEQLGDDLASVLAHFNIELAKVPRVNRSAHAHYADYYSPETHDIVAAVYADDIERFGYAY